MRNRSIAMLALAALSLIHPTLFAGQTSGCELTIVVDGQSRAEYVHRGATYIEAIRGREYSLRLSNPTPYRVAVALAVDGLNTIDAKHTDGWNASKWVLEPYESTEISGWQVNDQTARRFFFTGERHSYGAALGATENLGVIEAIFYRERGRPISRYRDQEREGIREPMAHGAPAPRSESTQQKAAADDDFAATGMGGRTRHDVERVDLDLDPRPIATLRLRYEFRPELVKLGVFPRSRGALERRERARGFEYCPQPQ